MENNYFDKKLKKILESPPDFELDASALSSMEKRLAHFNAKEKSRRNALLAGLLLFLPLFAGGFYFFTSFQKLNEQVQLLTSKLENIKKDTLQHKIITYQYDTIHTTIYKQKIIGQKITEPASSHAGPQSLYTFPKRNFDAFKYNDFISHWGLGATGPVLLTRYPNSSFFDLNNNELKKGGKEIFSKKDADKIPLRALKKLWLEKNISDELDNKKTDAGNELGEKNINPLLYFVPIGIKAGMRYAPYLNANVNGVNGANLLGINTELEFTGNVSLHVGAERLNIETTVKEFPVGFNEYPIVPPNEPGDVLHELKGSFNYLQIPVGIKKSFFNKNKLKPYISFGLTALMPYKQSFKYEYLSDTGEYELSSTFKSGTFNVNSWRAGIGMERPVFSEVEAQLELFYQRSNETGQGEYFPLKYFGVNLGLQYGF